jgi:DNA-binding NarL/FixJ family response regulator
MPTVLMLGDHEGVLRAWAGILQNAGYHLRTASLGHEGLALARRPFADVVVTNLRCLDMSPATLLQQLPGATGGRLPILVTPQVDDDCATVHPLDAVEHVDPVTSDHELVDVVERALRRHRRQHEGAGDRDASTSPAAPARVMVVATNRLLRDALEAALTGTPDLEVVLTAEEAEQVSSAVVDACMADIMLMDVAPSTSATIELVRELVAGHPTLKIIVIDTVHAASDLVDLLEAGVSGLLLKRATVDEILRTTRAVLGGATVIPQSLTRALFSVVAERACQPGIDEWQVTRREREIIALIADGLSNKEIATTLNIATFTVKSHVHNVLQKLGLRTRGQIARYVLLARTNTKRPQQEEVRRAVVRFEPDQARYSYTNGGRL